MSARSTSLRIDPKAPILWNIPRRLTSSVAYVRLNAGSVVGERRQGEHQAKLHRIDNWALLVLRDGRRFRISSGLVTQWHRYLFGRAMSFTIATRSGVVLVRGQHAEVEPRYSVSTQSLTLRYHRVLQGRTQPQVGQRRGIVVTLKPSRSYHSTSAVAGRTTRQSGAPTLADRQTNVPYTSNLGPSSQPNSLLISTRQMVASSQCVDLKPLAITNQGLANATTSGSVKMFTSAYEATEAMQTGGSVSYSGIADASGSVDYTTSSTASANSIYSLAQVSYVSTPKPYLPTLSATGLVQQRLAASIEGAIGVINVCGDSVPSSYTQGAVWSALIQIQARSESQAQSLATAFSVSAFGASASGYYNTQSSSKMSDLTATVNTSCVGPVGCAVSGYVPIPVAGSVPEIFAAVGTNFDAEMGNTAGLAGAVGSGIGSACATGCVASIGYQPLEQLFTDQYASNVSNMSTATLSIGTVQRHLQAWSSDYQSLAAAYTKASLSPAPYVTAGQELDDVVDSLASNAAIYADYKQRIDTVAINCSLGSLTNAACLPTYLGCAEVVTLSDVESACIPTAFSSLANIPNPDTLQPPYVINYPITCEQAFPVTTLAVSGVYELFIGGNQNASVKVWCEVVPGGTPGNQSAQAILPAIATFGEGTTGVQFGGYSQGGNCWRWYGDIVCPSNTLWAASTWSWKFPYDELTRTTTPQALDCTPAQTVTQAADNVAWGKLTNTLCGNQGQLSILGSENWLTSLNGGRHGGSCSGTEGACRADMWQDSDSLWDDPWISNTNNASEPAVLKLDTLNYGWTFDSAVAPVKQAADGTYSPYPTATTPSSVENFSYWQKQPVVMGTNLAGTNGLTINSNPPSATCTASANPCQFGWNQYPASWVGNNVTFVWGWQCANYINNQLGTPSSLYDFPGEAPVARACRSDGVVPAGDPSPSPQLLFSDPVVLGYPTAQQPTGIAVGSFRVNPKPCGTACLGPPLPPRSPLAVRATPGDGQVVVKWSKPFDQWGVLPIHSYTATVIPGGQSCSWDGGPLQCTVTGLQNCVLSSVSVTAGNAVGNGRASSPKPFTANGACPRDAVEESAPEAAVEEPAAVDAAPVAEAPAPSGVRWSQSGGKHRANFKGAPNTVYGIVGLKHGKSGRTGSCTVEGENVSCAIKLGHGTWGVSITPYLSGVRGSPLHKVIPIK